MIKLFHIIIYSAYCSRILVIIESHGTLYLARYGEAAIRRRCNGPHHAINSKEVCWTWYENVVDDAKQVLKNRALWSIKFYLQGGQQFCLQVGQQCCPHFG